MADRTVLARPPAAPHNGDAAFREQTKELKPSDLLLHYRYGATAVKRWGHGTQVLQDRANIPRPSVSSPSGVDSGAGKEMDTARSTTRRSKKDGAYAREEGRWDADDVMLFFWGNSPAARERHRRKEEKSAKWMEAWRDGVESP